MNKQTLSSAAKSLVNFADDTFDRPISFGDRPLPVVTQGAVTADSRKYDTVPTVVNDAIRYMENAEKIDSDEFHNFLAGKNANMNIRTDNDIFDQRAFDADMANLTRAYNEETAWLKMNPPKSPEAMSHWNQKLAERDAMRNQLPDPNSSKYHSKEIVCVTKSGLECRAILEQFKRECKKISNAFEAELLENYVTEHHIDMDDETFSFLKMMNKLGQFNYDFVKRIPSTVIRMGSSLNAHNDLETAVSCFNTVAEYNESLKTKNLSLSADKVTEERAQMASLMTSDIELAARAILTYATEFEALSKINSLDTPLI